VGKSSIWKFYMRRLIQHITLILCIISLTGCHLLHDYGDYWQTLGGQGFSEGAIDQDGMAIGDSGDGGIMVGLVEYIWDDQSSSIESYLSVMRYKDGNWDTIARDPFDGSLLSLYNSGIYVRHGRAVFSIYDSTNNKIYTKEYSRKDNRWNTFNVIDAEVYTSIQIHWDEFPYSDGDKYSEDIYLSYYNGSPSADFFVMKLDRDSNTFNQYSSVINEGTLTSIGIHKLYVYGDDVYLAYNEGAGTGGIQMWKGDEGSWSDMNSFAGSDLSSLTGSGTFDISVETGYPVIAYSQQVGSNTIWISRYYNWDNGSWHTLGGKPFSLMNYTAATGSETGLLLAKNNKGMSYVIYGQNETVIQKTKTLEESKWIGVTSAYLPEKKASFVDESGQCYFLYREQDGADAGKATVRKFGR
jgi:hypothetical protein